MSSSSIDSRIDDLYRGPLNDFVAARTALAKTLSGDEAKRVRALAKPTVVPWAVNQVYWRARHVHERLMKSGERLREAQVAALGGRKADVRAATDAHRRALADAVDQAERLAASAGAQPARDALMRTFEAISLAPERSDEPGRLTQALQPAGFEALSGVRVAANVAARVEAQRQIQEKERAQASARLKKEEAAAKKHAADVKKAEAKLELARRRMADAEAALKRTRDQSS